MKAGCFAEWRIGIVLALSAVAGTIGAANTHRLERRFGKRWIVSLSRFAALVAFGLIAFSSLETPAIVLLFGVEGIPFVSFSDSINRLMPSEHRATLLSFEAMAFILMMIPFFPAIGAVAGQRGFKTAFTVIFAAAVLVLMASRWLLLRRMRKEPSPAAC